MARRTKTTLVQRLRRIFCTHVWVPYPRARRLCRNCNKLETRTSVFSRETGQ